MNNKRYKIVNLKNKDIVYTDFVMENRAILEYRVNGENIEIVKSLDISNKDEYKVLESTKMVDSNGNFIYDEDTVEIEITVDYKPQGVVSIKNGTTIVKYKEKVFQKDEEPLYSAIGNIKILQKRA